MRWVLLAFAVLPVAYAIARMAGFEPTSALLSPFTAWFSFQCHQLPDRSHPLLPVCWRCAGLYLGLGLGALLPFSRLSRKRIGLWLGAAGRRVAADVWTDASGLRASSAPVRALTGLFLSVPIGSRGARIFAGRRAHDEPS